MPSVFLSILHITNETELTGVPESKGQMKTFSIHLLMEVLFHFLNLFLFHLYSMFLV